MQQIQTNIIKLKKEIEGSERRRVKLLW